MNTRRGIFRENLLLGYCFAPVWDVMLSVIAQGWHEFWTRVMAVTHTHTHTFTHSHMPQWIRAYLRTLPFCYRVTGLPRHPDIFPLVYSFLPISNLLGVWWCSDGRVSLLCLLLLPSVSSGGLDMQKLSINAWLVDLLHSSASLSASSKLYLWLIVFCEWTLGLMLDSPESIYCSPSIKLSWLPVFCKYL